MIHLICNRCGTGEIQDKSEIYTPIGEFYYPGKLSKRYGNRIFFNNLKYSCICNLCLDDLIDMNILY